MIMMKHDAHAAPPGELRALFKQWQKTSPETIDSNTDVLDTASLDEDHRVSRIAIDDGHHKTIDNSFKQFLGREGYVNINAQVDCFEVKALPGRHSLWQHDLSTFSF